MRQVFVSYSRKNLDAVTQLVRDLQAVGVDTWHDQSLTGGQRWWENILANIRQCDIFVFALSPDSLESEACKKELGYVQKLGKTILPVLVADGVNLNLLSHPLAEIHVTDCRGGNKESAFALVKSIMSVAATPPLPDPLPEAPQVPVSYLSGLNDRIESTETLTPQDQITLIFELQEELRDGRSPVEVRDLLLRLKRRDDLLAKIDTKIDEALKSLEKIEVMVPVRTPPNDPPTAIAHSPATDFCSKCGAASDAGSSFCRNCGGKLTEAAVASVPVEPPDRELSKIAGAKTRRYTCPPADTKRVMTAVKGWLESQNFDLQQMSTDDKGVVLQIKKRGAWRDWVGMATALNIMFHQSDGILIVQIGAGKWLDKAAAGGVALFVLWPLAIPAGIGIWEQAKLPEKIFDFIGSQLAYG